MKQKFFFAFLGVFLFFGSVAFAGNLHNVIGNWPNWTGVGSAGIWSRTSSSDGAYNGMGWISVNSLDCDSDGNGRIDNAACGTVGSVIGDYGVNINTNTSDVSGFAWNPWYGWIDFNPGPDMIRYPGCGYPQAPCHEVAKSGSALHGWIRILAIKNAFEAVPSNSGGWQGWIKTGGFGMNYGVTLDGSNVLNGFAWSQELGWIDFTGARIINRPTVNICSRPCGEASSNFAGQTFSSLPTTLYACYGTSNCSGGDVSVSGSWAAGNNPQDAIAISATGGSSTNVTRTYTGNGTATENIVFTCSAGNCPLALVQNATTTAQVACIALSCNSPSIQAETRKYCPTEKRLFDNNCGGQIDAASGGCPGTRDCDFNWREVAP